MEENTLIDQQNNPEILSQEKEVEEFYSDDEELNLSPEEPKKIIWQAKDSSLREFQSMKQDGDLVLQPEYQRKYVINIKMASRLIESIHIPMQRSHMMLTILMTLNIMLKKQKVVLMTL